MKFDLLSTAKEHQFIVAHRGVSGGNIPCNTMTAYETALKQGADMIEVDVDMTSDGVLVIFHPKMEKKHLGLDGSINDMTWDEVSKLRYVNYDRKPTQFGLLLFDDVLEHFKDRCYINVDKFWGHPVEIQEAIRRHGISDQILVKSALDGNVVSVLKEVAPSLPFMPIVKSSHPEHEALMNSGINYVGVEVLFSKEDMEVASPEFIDRMHRDGKLVWVNSIIYDVRAQLSAGHSDDTALSESMEKGWGWLADRGFDVIQTDWPLMLINYLKETNRYFK